MARLRKTLTVSFVGTEWVETTISSVPTRFFIKRARAAIDRGNSNRIALSIREKSETTKTIEIPLEYSLTKNPIDSGENILVESDSNDIYVAVKCDGGVNTVDVLIEYEEDS